jgi:hypothetical protein
VAALILVGLDVALNAPASRLTSLLALPAGLLAEWIDPGKPLIGVGKLTDAQASSTAPSASLPSTIGSDLAGGAGGFPILGPFISGANAIATHG